VLPRGSQAPPCGAGEGAWEAYTHSLVRRRRVPSARPTKRNSRPNGRPTPTPQRLKREPPRPSPEERSVGVAEGIASPALRGWRGGMGGIHPLARPAAASPFGPANKTKQPPERAAHPNATETETRTTSTVAGGAICGCCRGDRKPRLAGLERGHGRHTPTRSSGGGESLRPGQQNETAARTGGPPQRHRD